MIHKKFFINGSQRANVCLLFFFLICFSSVHDALMIFLVVVRVNLSNKTPPMWRNREGCVYFCNAIANLENIALRSVKWLVSQ